MGDRRPQGSPPQRCGRHLDAMSSPRTRMQQSDRNNTQEDGDWDLGEYRRDDAEGQTASTMSRDDVEPGIAQEKDAGDHRRGNRDLPLLPERPRCRSQASQQDDVKAG